MTTHRREQVTLPSGMERVREKEEVKFELIGKNGVGGYNRQRKDRLLYKCLFYFILEFMENGTSWGLPPLTTNIPTLIINS